MNLKNFRVTHSKVSTLERQCRFFFFKSDPLVSSLLSKAHKKTLAPEKWQADFDRFLYKINVF